MPKIIDHDKRREDIIDVAWQLIVEGGIEAATMREIATRAGFANGALKHYFSGKDAIIEGAYARSLGSLQKRLEGHVRGKRGIEALETAMRYTLPVDEESTTTARVLLSYWERCAFSSELEQGYGHYLSDWKTGYREFLRQGREDGDIVTTKSDEQIVSEIILLNIGAAVVRVVSPEHLSTQMLEDQVTDFVARLRLKPLTR
ncbi:TetR/AcrR family transcriptional regulator [Leucobacter sp. cx-328]|uniref:TetR/AcrR family transcriptional regulator n=1 Tax=unclassified Leucobacter TaxID=2621730 RepID=UPI00165D5243|nr:MULTISPECIES: TetR/AcrR family transcriptional regulator [unclassified Leucobacter]MBC9943088.1 TetR/AcrR family transcriptional regulator [Leucobacter sp. cx-328]